MTPDQLLTFATVAEYGNISHAADALNLSQPAVSGQLRLLQEEFGEPLYRRQGRGIRLTEAGRQLVAHAERLRTVYRQAHAYRDALRGLERGALRIGASTTPASYLLPYLIAEFHQRYPEISIHTLDGNTGEIVATTSALDIAMIEGPVPADLAPDTEVHSWRDDEIVAVVPAGHALTSRGATGASLAQLAAHPMIWREPGSGVRLLVERAFANAAVPAHVTLELAGVEGVKEAVRAGMGIGFVSAMSMRHDDQALTTLRIDPPRGLKRRLSILVPHASTPSRAAQRFLEICLSRSDGG
jgi:DNA-binding transcriptional LysR family regulator